MLYGPVPNRALPEQHGEKLLLLAERWSRAAGAHETWAKDAKLAVDFVEGRQWTADEIAKLEKQGRPALRFNKIGPLVRLVLGYQRNNKSDARVLPGHDGSGTEQVADALTRILKQVSESSQLPYVDTEVFMDGITGGRGFYDTRLCFDDNDFGEIKTKAVDPFTMYLDPDATAYDLNDREGCGYIVQRRWTNPDEIEWAYGRTVADLVAPLARGATPIGPILSTYGDKGEITPVRAYGNKDEDSNYGAWWDSVHSLLGEYVDPLRRNLAVLDFQHYITERKRCFIDLETGDRSVIPDHWDKIKIEKCLWHAEQIGNPLTISVRPVRRVRWTTIVGDVTVYDDWSPYDAFTVTGFFPWFRRGFTQGMVSDLIDPQREVNKRRSVEIETVMRTTNSGWKYHEDALDPVQEANLKRNGAAPGFTMKWKGTQEPKRIEPAAPPTAMERLEDKARADLREISGINESALGELDRVQSGRAIEARMRQSVIALQVYLDNFSRSKELLARQHVNLIQKHYTEPRVFRILGEDGKFVQTAINHEQMDPASGLMARLDDVTIGKYSVVIDERPMAATYASAQYEEALSLIKELSTLNPQAGAMLTDVLIDASTLPRKDELKERVQQAMGIATPPGMPGGVPPAGAPGAPMMPPGGVPVQTGALPPSA